MFSHKIKEQGGQKDNLTVKILKVRGVFYALKKGEKCICNA